MMSSSRSGARNAGRGVSALKRPPGGAHARGVKIAHEIEALLQHLDGVRADLLAAEPRGVGGGEDGADRRAGDDLGAQAELVEGFQHRNVRQPARAAAAERQGDARACRAAARVPAPAPG